MTPAGWADDLVRPPFLVGHRTRSAADAQTFAAAGATYVELDVRQGPNGPVVTHFGPVRGTRGRLERDNARFRLTGRAAPDPAVADLLAGLPPARRVLFDPKQDEGGADLAAALAGLVDDPGRHVVSLRNRGDSAAFAAHGFQVWWTLDTAEAVRGATSGRLPVDGVTVRHRTLGPEPVRRLHDVTDTVVAWTVDSVERALELLAFGVDGITTHDPAVMAAVRRKAGY